MVHKVSEWLANLQRVFQLSGTTMYDDVIVTMHTCIEAIIAMNLSVTLNVNLHVSL